MKLFSSIPMNDETVLTLTSDWIGVN